MEAVTDFIFLGSKITANGDWSSDVCSSDLASSPITSSQIEGEKVEPVTDFLFLGSKITADGDYSQEIRRRLLLGRKALTNLVQFSSVQPLIHVRLFVTPWTAACQGSLSITNSRSLLKLMSIKSVMTSNHLILCHPFLLLSSIFPSIFPRFSPLQTPNLHLST